MSFSPSPATPIIIGIVLAIVIIPVMVQVVPNIAYALSEAKKIIYGAVQPKNEYWKAYEEKVVEPTEKWSMWALTNKDTVLAIVVVDSVILMLAIYTLLRR